MDEAKLQELLKDRDVMPTFDDSIFYPERRWRALGFDEDDIQVLVDVVRWHMQQRDLRLLKQQLVEVLKMRRGQLIIQKRVELHNELEQLSQIS
jgi:hypothetical protein